MSCDLDNARKCDIGRSGIKGAQESAKELIVSAVSKCMAIWIKPTYFVT